MEKIPSFQKNHDKLAVGLHMQTDAHGVTTFDLRFKKPNAGDYITPDALHSIEHMLATVLRNSREKDNVLYFGPMGCRTGFYLLTINLTYDEVRALLTECVSAALALEEIPGAKREECGNFLAHDLQGAKKELTEYAVILRELATEESP